MRIDRAKLFGTLKAGFADRSGATAVAFAVGFAVTAPLALGVFDIYSSSQQRGKLQDALDAATLYAAKSTETTDAGLDAAGEKSLAANLKLIDGAVLLGADFHTSGTKVVSSASVRLPAFAPALFTHAPVSVGSQVERAMDNLEIALVLDNTGSMSGTKIATLITESKKLVDKLQVAAQRSADPANAVKIALVPFSFAVRVQGDTDLSGANYNTATRTGANIPTWLDPQGKAHRASSAANYDIFTALTDRLAIMQSLQGKTWAGCVESRTYPYDVKEDPPEAGTAASWFVPYFWPDEPDTNGYANNYIVDNSKSTWKLVEQDETKYTKNYKSGKYGSSFSAAGGSYKYGPNAGCTLQPVIKLTNDLSSIKTAIDGMKAVGTTNIPQGLVWGWHAISPKAPLASGRAYDTPHNRKIIILMTDGQNTFLDAKNSNNLNESDYTGLGFIWQNMLGLDSSSSNSERTSVMDARLTELCTNVKKEKIEIYTILVEDSSSVSTLLQSCATTPDKFYNVQSVTTLGVAFDAIAGAITNLRLSH
jgi:Flp pilus assembly protein TadG